MQVSKKQDEDTLLKMRCGRCACVINKNEAIKLLASAGKTKRLNCTTRLSTSG